MKKLVLLLSIIPAILCAQSDVKFMGIPVDCSYKQFTSELAGKIHQNYDSVYYSEFHGTFAGLSNCKIMVSNGQTKDVTRILVEKNISSQPEVAQKLKSAYDEKYGSPIDVSQVLGTIYTYRKGSVQINLSIDYDRSTSLPKSVTITYFPWEYKEVTGDEI